MTFFNKNFFAGLVVGVVLTVVGIVTAALLVVGPLIDHVPQVAIPPEIPETSPIAPLRPAADWSLRDLSGKPFALRSQRGHVVFLNRWATWCGPCVAEMPGIQALYDSLRAEGVVFVLVSDEAPAKVREFVAGRKFRVPVYLCEGKPPAAYQSRGIPATFILDRSGNVVIEHSGAAYWNSPRCRRYLRRLLSR